MIARTCHNLLINWRGSSDLSLYRDGTSRFFLLPASEADDWAKLWSRIDALHERTRSTAE